MESKDTILVFTPGRRSSFVRGHLQAQMAYLQSRLENTTAMLISDAYAATARVPRDEVVRAWLKVRNEITQVRELVECIDKQIEENLTSVIDESA